MSARKPGTDSFVACSGETVIKRYAARVKIADPAGRHTPTIAVIARDIHKHIGPMCHSIDDSGTWFGIMDASEIEPAPEHPAVTSASLRAYFTTLGSVFTCSAVSDRSTRSFCNVNRAGITCTCVSPMPRNPPIPA
jgi:hypothetical protein